MTEDDTPAATEGQGGRPVRRGGGGGRGQGKGQGGPLLREVEALRSRVEQLEDDIQELRQLNKRVAEVTDAVAEVLLPASDRDDDRVRELLAAYDRTL